MAQFDNVSLEKIIIHKVGNPSRAEELNLSVQPITLNDEVVKTMLIRYFLQPFDYNAVYQFSHISDISLNEIHQFTQTIFKDPQKFTEQSHLIARYLYSKSTHVKVKEGELYIAYLREVPFREKTVSAIGIFKSESRETFLKVFPHGQNWEVIQEEGVNINKLDKGCLIFNTLTDDSPEICVVDTVNKQNDTRYWMEDFLQVVPAADSYHHTKQSLDLCKGFIQTAYPNQFEVAKTDQIDMLNKAMDYFKTHDQFEMDEFAHEVMHHDEVVESFKAYKKNYESAHQLEIDEQFDIHSTAVKKQERSFKTVLKLDKNFHVYIHGRRDLVEKGYDEMAGKKYYKLYFDEEA